MANLKQSTQIVLLGWFAMLGWDFFLHGGLLAGFYQVTNAFLLPPMEAFRRIPLGYVSFLFLTILLVWLLPRFSFVNWQRAMWFGIKLGGLIWGSFVLGLVSISTIDLNLALGWFVGQTIELGIGAVVVQQAANAKSLRRLTAYVFLFVFLALIITIAMQSVGLAPAL